MKELFIALDFKQEGELWHFMDRFKDQQVAVKVGMSQFYLSGPDLVRRLADKGHKVFLDLKCHDIPNTVYLAMRQVSQLPVSLLTVHTLGGLEMLQAAVQGAKEGVSQPKVLGITQLTSTSQAMLHQQMGIASTLDQSVLNLARLAYSAGLDGIVSSVWEVGHVKTKVSSDLLCLCPGIRVDGHTSDDQERIATPDMARKAGADFIVVGRPIIQAADPLSAYQKFLQEWRGISGSTN